MSAFDHSEFRPPGHRIRRRDARAGRSTTVLVSVLATLAVVAGVAGGWYWWREWSQAPQSAAVPAPVPEAPKAEPAQPAAPQAATHIPVDESPQPLAAAQVPQALSALLGSRTVKALLALDDFPRRFVATVDNLPSQAAPLRVWPLVPAPGRFAVDTSADGATISAANAARYTPYVTIAQTLDPRAAVALYRRMYPLLQQAYAELGRKDAYFNDRLVQVIDDLLATPEPAQPPAVQMFEVKGPVADPRPWVHWEFADPALQSRSAGQKILLRMGTPNERVVKQKLREIRALLVAGSGSR